MAKNLYLSRDTKVYLVLNDTHTWEIPVLDGYALSQATNASEVTLAEMEGADGVSRRGKRVFNDALAPAEWSFTTYVRPFASAGGGTTGLDADDTAGNVHAVDEALWAIMAGPAYYENFTFKDAAAGTAYFTQGTDSVTLDFTESNRSVLGEGMATNPYLVFRFGEAGAYKYYKLSEIVVNEATMDFDIDGIASINWSGMGSVLAETAVVPTVTINESITNTTNFIRNRLTQLTVTPDQSVYNTGDLQTTYDITLTGGSITISNNVTFITPEELGIVNYPIGHVTGNRSISGNFTAYLVAADASDADVNESSDFWADLSALTDVVTHNFNLTFSVGGSANFPRLQFTFPKAHVEIPTFSVEDVISLETTFTGLGTSLDTADEATVTYYAQ